MKIRTITMIALWIGIFLSACSPSVGQQNPPVVMPTTAPTAAPTPLPEQAGKTAVDSALAALMQKQNITAEKVKISAVEEVDWPDTCLGIQRPEESCGAMITPGYRIVLEAGGSTYEFRTNLDGSQVRAVEKDTPVSEPVTERPPAVSAAVQALANHLNVALDIIKVVSSEWVEWPDGCLGISTPGIMCTQVITPGYRVMLEVNGIQYEVRTNESGTAAVPVKGPPDIKSFPKPEGAVVEWEGTVDSECGQLIIGAQSAAVGVCGGPLSGMMLSKERIRELNVLQSLYSSFKLNTEFGVGQFVSSGAKAPTAAEVRSVAEWARLVYIEAQGIRAEAEAGAAFTWRREGGIAGFCDTLTIYRSGWAVSVSCKAGGTKVVEPYRLSPNELEQLYGWLDTLAPFNYETKDSAKADAMLVQLYWLGSGLDQATPAQQEEIAGFAGQVYANAVNR